MGERELDLPGRVDRGIEDLVVEQGGATVYLDQSAAELLDDKVLDAAVDQSGKVEFALGLQG